MRWILWWSVAVWSLGVVEVAEARQLSVTVYNQNLGVVRDTRTVELVKGESMLKVVDVAAQIDPTSVHLRGPLEVLEQNFSYDLASADAILQRYLGEGLDVQADEGRTYRGTLLAFDRERIVLGGAGEAGGVTIVERDGVHDLRFPALPEGLKTKPTLIWQVDAERAGATEVELLYMTTGLEWHAEYVAVLAEDEQSFDLSGWVSVENRSGASYPNAKLKLVAGDVHRAPPPHRPQAGRAEMAYAADGDAFKERGLFEYHIYDLGRPTTLADREVKQIALLEALGAPLRKRYEFDSRRSGKVEVLVETENSSAAGLGMPLPAGVVRAMKSDADGQLEFVGEDRIDHTPANEKLKIRLGAAFDVVGERLVKDARRLSDRVQEQTIEIKLRNRKPEAVEIIVKEPLHGSWEILDASHAYEKQEAYLVEFTVGVAAQEESILTYRFRTR